MALGALVAAYGEADGGDALRATLPLAGRTLLAHQVRTAAALGAAPVVVLVERVPEALVSTMDELAGDGIPVAMARSAAEAAELLPPDGPVLVVGDGVVAPRATLERVAHVGAPAVLTLPDNPGLERWERIDGGTRWGGVALATPEAVADVADMLGEWDMPSTLLRRLVQDGAARVPVRADGGAPILALHAGELHGVEKRLLASASPLRHDWARARLLPFLEGPAVARLAPTTASPAGLLWGAVGLMLLSAFFFGHGWLGAGLIAALCATPVAGVAERLAAVRMQPLRRAQELRLAFLAAAVLALLVLAGRLWLDGAGWGVVLAAVGVPLWAAAQRGEARHARSGAPAPWLLSVANAAWASIPLAALGWWAEGVVALFVWGALSFFAEQRRAHRPAGPAAAED